MFDYEFYFSLPPGVPQEAEWPEAFDRTIRPTRTLTRRQKAAQKTPSVLLLEFLSELKNERHLSSQARGLYETDLEIYLIWLQACGVTKIRDVSTSLVEQYAHDLRCGQVQIAIATQRRPALKTKFLAASTVARKLAAVRAWHQFLARRYKWPDPAAHLESTTFAPNASLALSAEQIQNLLAAPNVLQINGLRDYAILCLLCEGLSPQEIRALRYEESEWPFGETARRGVQQYITRARPLLLARLKKKGRYSRCVFFTNRGTAFSPVLMQKIVRRYADTAQLPPWVSASHLHKAGAARRARGADISENSGTEVAALPRAAQLRHAYSKAHPRA